MSSLKRIFGYKTQTATPESALEALRNTEELLIKKQAYIERKIDDEREKAKKFGLKQKKSALMCLKRSKVYEKQLQHIDGALMTIENQRNTLDSVQTNKVVLNSMTTANAALKNVHKDLNVDRIHDIMDEIGEQNDLASEIADAISSGNATNEFDDDELLAELNALEEESVAGKLLDVSSVGLPSVPAGEPIGSKHSIKKSQEEEEEEELTRLMAWSS